MEAARKRQASSRSPNGKEKDINNTSIGPMMTRLQLQGYAPSDVSVEVSWSKSCIVVSGAKEAKTDEEDVTEVQGMFNKHIPVDTKIYDLASTECEWKDSDLVITVQRKNEKRRTTLPIKFVN